MEDAMKKAVSTGDFLRVKSDLLEVLSAGDETIFCRLYKPMTVDIITRFSLQPIMTSLFPIAAQSNIVEVVGTACTMSAARSDIEDIIFIVPIQELESGMVHITGATNLYFARYGYDERDDKLLPYPFSLYFSIQYVSPFGDSTSLGFW
jgi:hypothetical protein